MTREDIAKLSVADRLALIGDLWDSVEETDAPLSANQRNELMRRLNAFEAEKTNAATWESVAAELDARRR